MSGHERDAGHASPLDAGWVADRIVPLAPAKMRRHRVMFTRGPHGEAISVDRFSEIKRVEPPNILPGWGVVVGRKAR